MKIKLKYTSQLTRKMWNVYKNPLVSHFEKVSCDFAKQPSNSNEVRGILQVSGFIFVSEKQQGRLTNFNTEYSIRNFLYIIEEKNA